jgi:hypothetical protein
MGFGNDVLSPSSSAGFTPDRRAQGKLRFAKNYLCAAERIATSMESRSIRSARIELHQLFL